MKECYLALEDGYFIKGTAFGADGERYGEVVFNTSMSGYQEILTDPSYKGQIVTMTYPMIGNYGVNPQDVESWRPHVEGFVVKEASKLWSNWRSQGSLSDYLRDNGIVGIEGVDTRALVLRIRTRGAMKGVISTEDGDRDRLVQKAKDSPGLVGIDLVKEVTRSKPEVWTAGDDEAKWFSIPPERREDPFNVVAMDFGIKNNILRLLTWSGCRVTVVPANISAKEIMEYNPDGVFLSNGPGDPAAVDYAVSTVRELLGKRPIFGICLGQQLLGLALGGKTFKLKFGHRGANHPVSNIERGRVEITVQNHGFCVDMETLPPDEVKATHINLNDRTLEGFRHLRMPAFSVQYHPESSPGPHDASYLFREFIDLMKEFSGK